MWTERGGNSSLQRETPVTNRVQHTFQVTNLPLQYEKIDAVNVKEIATIVRNTQRRGAENGRFLDVTGDDTCSNHLPPLQET